MYILGLLVNFCLCIQNGHLLTVSLETSPPVYDESIRLRCSGVGSTCCTSEPRTWSKDGVVILSNGQTTNKYKEDWNTTGQYFTLIIELLEDSDFNHAYSCQYGFLTPGQMTLTQDGTAIYLPKESECPMVVNNEYLTGTLTIAKCAPFPTILASLGNTNLTPSLTITGPTVLNTFFYTVTVSINKKIDTEALCSYKELFNLSVVTSTRSTPFCVNEDFCKCLNCGGRCYGWSELLPFLLGIVLLVIIYRKTSLLLYTIAQKKLAGIVLVLVLVIPFGFAFFIGWRLCHCIAFKDPWFIICGTVCIIIAWILILGYPFFCSDKVNKEKESTVIFICPIDIKTTTVRWQRVTLPTLHTEDISEGENIANSSIKDRVSIVGDHKAAQYDLQLSRLQESDKGFYRCIFGKQQDKYYKLEISGTHSSNSGLLYWASCKVDQEPVNPSKNSAQPKGKATKTPNNETNKKPEAKHIKTESLETERSYADDKNFESNLNKVPQDRPLPQPNLTPRPLPPKPGALPPITEKKPETIGDINETTTEKKKKKRRKKEENDEL